MYESRFGVHYHWAPDSTGRVCRHALPDASGLAEHDGFGGLRCAAGGGDHHRSGPVGRSGRGVAGRRKGRAQQADRAVQPGAGILADVSGCRLSQRSRPAVPGSAQQESFGSRQCDPKFSGGEMNLTIALQILDLAFNVLKTQTGGKLQQDATVGEILLQIVAKARQAYEMELGQPLDPSLIKTEPPA